ncbi:hypothetical protein F5B22DRAFT_612266 [Xylaria bambusicola]|uniref:uncharacterized protein n=1 Tax=Xylaria bambusicola TaxID=326684 RepID=UPI0020075941|nr:uncharacterized protein F5B22DRAFT_612266 [Xylaria bambusicola]KAI0513103.1 hypothetical protein F5B22DRAFT_612266 [Xylaria bambusicola]
MATVSPYKRDSLPFIHRAWKTAVDNFPRYGAMGIKLSTANGDTSTNGDHPPRPLKRRRVDEASPDTARAMPGRLVPAVPDDVDKTLRIEVLSITRSSSNQRSANLHYGNGSPEKKDIPVIKARCRVLVCEWAPDICRVLHCDSQICNFKVFRDSDDVCRTARIYLPAPFQVPTEKLLIERAGQPGNNLGDQYLIRVEIESAGDLKSPWPPTDLLSKQQGASLGFDESRRWILSSQIIYGFEKGRASGEVKLRKLKEDFSLGLTMDMDLRWSTHAAATSARLGESAPPPDVTANHTNGITNGVLQPLTNGHVNGKVDATLYDHQKAESERNGVAEDEEEHEEATTPSRSLRTREKQNYNLKLLSDKARGKERKEKKRRKLATLERKGGGVTWAVPLIGEFTLDNYHCIRCFATHVCLEQLQEHLKFHTDIVFHVDPANAYIRIFAPDEDALRSANATFHSFSSLEDQESDVEGEVSPQKLPKRPSQQRNKSSQPQPAKPKDNRRLIPHIKQPLYDRLSKSLLEPDSLVDPPPVNDTWLVQKHRDIIRDYSDVHQDEKEYIFEWDAYVNRDCVTSEPQLQDLYIKFIQDKSTWISASQNRATEWAKHLSYLKSRNALTEETITEAFTIMRQSRSQKRLDPDATKVSPPRPAYRKSVAGCPVCGQPVRGPAIVVCSNSDCNNALYHTECIRSEAKQPVESRNWRCNKCHDEQKTT